MPAEPTYAFAQDAAKAGISTKLVRFPHGDHVFDLEPNGIGSQGFRQLSQSWFDGQGPVD